MPNLFILVDLKIHETMWILVAGRLDRAGDLKRFRFVISSPAVMRKRKTGRKHEHRDQTYQLFHGILLAQN